MTKEEFKEILPFLNTLTIEQTKVLWYIEARKHGNPCITDEQKKKALERPLTDIPKIKLHGKRGNNTD